MSAQRRPIRRLVTVYLSLALAAVATTTTATQASAAPSCSGAVCMYLDSDYRPVSSNPLVGARAMSGSYPNLKNQNFNDVMSSINNTVGHTQQFYDDANAGGFSLAVGPGVAYNNLANVRMPWNYVGLHNDWNDRISSVYWIG